MTTTRLPHPPRGWKAVPWRLPIWFYRLGLGGLLGERFLLLTHTGRVSGMPRQAVVEVVYHDAGTNSYYVASGFGERSQWYRNILANPQVTVQVGNRVMAARAERLSVAEGERRLAEYARRHPTALRELSRLLRLPYDGSPESLHKLAELLPVVAFHCEGKSPA
jgi:deazaflavin-dependent oxidoreductase (nitroreductase family)